MNLSYLGSYVFLVLGIFSSNITLSALTVFLPLYTNIHILFDLYSSLLSFQSKAETPVLWPPHEKSWLIGKDSDAGRDWGQEKKGTTKDEMVGWHHWLDGRESEWTPGVGDGQGGPACCNSWGRKESDMTERLNWTELIIKFIHLMFNFNYIPCQKSYFT